ncbi:hypothetical protein Thena_1035 [Thermodesulfobium narugense DSM 14796]|uniref:Inner membrane protein YgaP-like transmembrane domain-containing protein n=1 Tax=Thermodesulfobium narugense DSM 14796 TaxID=747365 RepID=M1E8T3_9BACT|nr:DUF2892 domain-containing protein [Thermodesulfobium narugense]AEE14664.1 hypothetical protein Thena_1035 [Thermodesulfobium narugense DSM 14796]
MYKAPTQNWYLERIIFLIAGMFVLVSLFLGLFWSPFWFILTFLVGINLVIFALTGFCIMANILYKLGVKSRLK